MPNDFQQGYRSHMWKAKGFESPPAAVSIDPTKTFPSVETTTEDHGCSGVFFKFNVSPTSFDLDPYFFFQDHDFAITSRAGIATDLNHSKNPVKAASGQYSVQPMAFRAPMFLSGWGYDICGLPVPTSGASFEISRNFNEYAGLDRRLWKSGPVDLRWDDERKVWTGGPEVVEGKMVTHLRNGDTETPALGTGIIYRGKGLRYSTYEADLTGSGIILPNPYTSKPTSSSVSGEYNELIQIVNRNPGISLNSGDYFSAVKINYEWRIMSADGGGKCIVGKFKKQNCSVAVVPKTILPPFQSIKASGVGGGKDSYKLKFTNIGYKRVFCFKSENELLKDLIPSESSGGKMAAPDGTLDINVSINDGVLPYSGYIAVVAFANCEKSSDVYTYKMPGSGEYPDGTGTPTLVHQKPLNKLYDCPTSDDNFGVVTDDQTGFEFYATHPFKYIKHNVRVIACKSNIEVICNNERKSSYLIVETDDWANAGTSISRE